MTVKHHAWDVEPGVGTILEVGSPGDHIVFVRAADTWLHAHNGDPLRPCTYQRVLFWAPLRRTTRRGPAAA